MDSAPPLWHNGPVPGALYNFPGNSSSTKEKPVTVTQSPAATGASVIGLCYEGGVMLAADTLASYGSMARFKNVSRLMRVNDYTVVGASGDYADFQYLKEVVEQKVIDDENLDDGFQLKPRSLHCWLTRVLYNRRSKFDPLWNTFLVAGLQDGEPFLGYVDKIGTAYKDKYVVSGGLGGMIAITILRDALDKNPNPSESEARSILQKCLSVIFMRDGRSYHKYEIATCTKDGVTVDGPHNIQANWEIAKTVVGYE